MIKNSDARKMMLYIIEGEGHTLTETAKHFKVSRTDVKNYVNKINDENDEFYDEALSEAVNEYLLQALKSARAKAGSKSRKKHIINEEEALALRFKNLYANIPLRKLAEDYNCSFMTISKAINNLPENVKKAQDETAKKLLKK